MNKRDEAVKAWNDSLDLPADVEAGFIGEVIDLIIEATVEKVQEQVMHDSIEAALKIVDKRESLCKNAQPCPKCKTKQIQLIEHINQVIWKCRHCKYEWMNEEDNK